MPSHEMVHVDVERFVNFMILTENARGVPIGRYAPVKVAELIDLRTSGNITVDRALININSLCYITDQVVPLLISK